MQMQTRPRQKLLIVWCEWWVVLVLHKRKNTHRHRWRQTLMMGMTMMMMMMLLIIPNGCWLDCVYVRVVVVVLVFDVQPIANAMVMAVLVDILPSVQSTHELQACIIIMTTAMLIWWIVMEMRRVWRLMIFV